MKKNIGLFIICGIISFSVYAQEQIVERIGVEQAIELIDANIENDNFVVLDIRTEPEFEQGHIEDAILINYYAPDFKVKLDSLDKDKLYFVYCRSGNRSGKSLKIFKELGFKFVYELRHGIKSWVADGNKLSYN